MKYTKEADQINNPSERRYVDYGTQKVARELVNRTETEARKEAISGFGMKHKAQILIDLIRSAMFPNIYDVHTVRRKHFVRIAEDHLGEAAVLLDCMLAEILVNACELENRDTSTCTRCKARARKLTRQFIGSLPAVVDLLNTDIVAAYNGDPAAISHEEILLAYPGFDAVSVHRLAHELYKMELPLLPRVMSELAHSKTGIDIHPGATIGDHFFIDHGTGVVIGETCVIGHDVKIYQGVTLGARSFELDEDGNPVKGVKRHPDIEDNVIIYAGATILGGDTRIGHDSVIGGNVWLTHSIDPYSTVYNADPPPLIHNDTME